MTTSSFPRWDRTPLGDDQDAYQPEEAQVLLDAEHPSSVVLPVVSS